MRATEQIALIIDPNSQHRATIRRYLNQNGDKLYNFLEEPSGSGGLAACRAHQPACVLLAYHLPDMKALDFLAELSGLKELTRCPAVILTGVDSEATGQQALRRGAQEYLLQEQASPETLHRAVSNALTRANLLAERQAAEAALRQKHDLLQNVIAGMTDGIYVRDLQGRYLFVNGVATEIIGLTPEEIMGKTYHELFSASAVAQITAEDQAVLASGEPQASELVSSQGGQVRTFHSIRLPYRDPQGNIVGILNTVRDITERKQAEIALRQSQERLQVVLRAGRMGWWDRNLRTNETVWSDSLFDLLNQSPDSRPSYELFLQRVHPDDRQKVQSRVRQAVDERSRYSAEYRLLHPNGGVRWVLEKGQIIYDEAGEPRRIVGVSLDITQRKWVEEGLRESEATLRSFYDSAPLLMGLVETGQDDILHLYDNPAAHRFLGLASNQSSTGRWASQLGTPAAAIREWLDHFKACESSGQPVHFEYIHDNPGSPRWLAATVSLIGPGPSGRTRFCYIAEEISERKQAEAQQRLLAELSETMRHIEEPDELLLTVVRVVGEHLQVKRCLFTEIDTTHDRGLIRHEYCLGVPSIAGEYKISDYSQITRIDMEAGRTVVNTDAQADPRTAAHYETTYQRYGERAYVAVPLRREGQWVAALWVSADTPRQWRADEIALLETVAQRTWLAVENARLNIATKAALEQARASEQWFRELADSLPQLVWISNSEGVLDYYNRRVSEYGGASRTPEGIWQWKPLLHPDDLEPTLAAWQSAVASEQPYSFEHRVRMTDGSYRWHLSRAVPIRDGTGAIKWFGTATDIHDLRVAQAALREKNQ